MPNPLLPTSHNPTSSRPSRLNARRISPIPPVPQASNDPLVDHHEHHEHHDHDHDQHDRGLPPPPPPPTGLSEKAKGKRRATNGDLGEDDPVDEVDLNVHEDSRHGGKGEEKRGRSITFRFTGEAVDLSGSDGEGGEGEGEGGTMKDLDVWVDAGESVGRVKDKIKSLLPALHPHPLKFIHSGRLLTDGILLLPYVRTLEGRYRLVLGQGRGGGRGRGEGQGQAGLGGMVEEDEAEVEGDEEEKVWLHCVVGAKVDRLGVTKEGRGEDEEEGEVEGDGSLSTPTQPRRRGFDALLDAGLSTDEVAHMRRTFYAGRGEEVPDGLEEDDEHTRALEEQWIEGDLTNETAQTAAEGIYTSILTGLLIGFLYPILPWFFFREIPAPNFFDPLEVEHDRSGSMATTTGGTGTGSSTAGLGRSAEVLEEPLDWSMGILPNATGSSGSAGAGSGSGSNGPNTGGRTGASEMAPGNPGMRGLFGLRGRAGGEWVTGVVFGQRVQMAILIGTVLNIGFGAFRFLV